MQGKTRSSLFVLLLGLASLAPAQIFKVQGGTSTMVNANGGSVEFLSPDYQGTFGVGVFENHFGIGGTLRYPYHGYTIITGDDSIPFNLPTDLFDSSHYFLTRGIGVSRASEDGNMLLMAGTTALGFGAGFFQIAHSQDPVGVFFMERRLDHHLRLFSRNILAAQKTSLQGLDWQPCKWLDASVTGGAGSDQLYAATGMEAKTRTFAVKASYVDTGSEFRRITISSPLSSEVNRGNVEAVYQPLRAFSISAEHHKLLEPLTPTAPLSAASVNELVTNFNVARMYFGSGLFSSQFNGKTTTGTNFYAGRPIGSRLEVTCNYFESRPKNNSLTTILSGTVRETISRRFNLLQVVSRSNGQTTVSYGGELLTNRFKVGVDYQNVYLPFRPDRPFEQALTVNADLQVSGPFRLTGSTNVAPDGHLRYTFGASTFLYRDRSLYGHAGETSYSFPKYLVQGIVRDTDGAPVAGASLRIGSELAYTDDSGHFEVRFRRNTPMQLRVAIDEFLTPGGFEVVQAPTAVQPDPERQPSMVLIVIRRIAPIATRSSQNTSK